jgi:hypothetical protein
MPRAVPASDRGNETLLVLQEGDRSFGLGCHTLTICAGVRFFVAPSIRGIPTSVRVNVSELYRGTEFLFGQHRPADGGEDSTTRRTDARSFRVVVSADRANATQAVSDDRDVRLGWD